MAHWCPNVSLNVPAAPSLFEAAVMIVASMSITTQPRSCLPRMVIHGNPASRASSSVQTRARTRARALPIFSRALVSISSSVRHSVESEACPPTPPGGGGPAVRPGPGSPRPGRSRRSKRPARPRGPAATGLPAALRATARASQSGRRCGATAPRPRARPSPAPTPRFSERGPIDYAASPGRCLASPGFIRLRNPIIPGGRHLPSTRHQVKPLVLQS
jgi:hypothetical protein